MPASLSPDVILNTMQWRAGVNLRRQIPHLPQLGKTHRGRKGDGDGGHS